MALDYYLTLRNRICPVAIGEVRRNLLISFGLKTNPLSDILVGEGFSVSVFQEDHDRAERHGFSHPGACVAFRIDKFEAYDTGIEHMLRIVKHLLREFEGEATLTFEFEDTLLIVTKNQMSFTEEDPGFWTPARKHIFTEPT